MVPRLLMVGILAGVTATSVPTSALHAQDPTTPITIRAARLLDGHGRLVANARGVFFDPNIGLVLQNYVENKDKFIGVGNYDEEGFAFMEGAIDDKAEMFGRAVASGVRMPLGTDAVAGAHGQNAREIIARVIDGGQPAGDALIGATSLAAESLGLETLIGTLAAGFEADIIAVSGNPLQEIRRLQDVVFVVKGGTVYKR